MIAVMCAADDFKRSKNSVTVWQTPRAKPGVQKQSKSMYKLHEICLIGESKNVSYIHWEGRCCSRLVEIILYKAVFVFAQFVDYPLMIDSVHFCY